MAISIKQSQASREHQERLHREAEARLRETPCECCGRRIGYRGSIIKGFKKDLPLCSTHHKQFWDDEVMQESYDTHLYGVKKK